MCQNRERAQPARKQFLRPPAKAGLSVSAGVNGGDRERRHAAYIMLSKNSIVLLSGFKVTTAFFQALV